MAGSKISPWSSSLADMEIHYEESGFRADRLPDPPIHQLRKHIGALSNP
jgi:hypothetical protein